MGFAVGFREQLYNKIIKYLEENNIKYKTNNYCSGCS